MLTTVPGLQLLVREPSSEGGNLKQATVDGEFWDNEGSGHSHRLTPRTPVNSPVARSITDTTGSPLGEFPTSVGNVVSGVVEDTVGAVTGVINQGEP